MAVEEMRKQDFWTIIGEIFRKEQAFRDAQERYDLFVMRHYGQRYEPWFEEASDRYRLRIRRLYFRLLKLDRMERELRENQTNGRVSPTATAQTKSADKADTPQERA